MRSWWSRGARTRRTRKGTTTATTVSTWRGKRAPAIGMRSNATSTTSCAACPIGRRTWRNGRIAVGFLGGAQVDRYGNINTTVIGSYERPAVRLPGSGGAAEIAIHARRTLVVAKLSPRTFPAHVDFITSPGHGGAGASRRQLRMPGAGPVKVITDKAVLEVDEGTGELVLAALYPGVEASDVRGCVGWPLACRPRPGRVAPPDATELRRIDPAPLAGRPEWTAYGVMRASLEGKVAIRPCHYELWNVSHVNLGWLPIVTSLAAVQPVGSDELRAQALARWQAIPLYIASEMANQREGLRLGYSAPQSNARVVIKQLDQL